MTNQQKINSAISELLAVLHGDGGHYEQSNGKLKAIRDAQKLLHIKWIINEHFIQTQSTPSN